MSDALRDIDGIDWIRKREALPRNTHTFAFNQDPRKVRQAAHIEATSNFKEWFGGRWDIEIREDVIGLGDYGKTLTMLYEIDIPEEGEDDEGELIESWTPRFRR